MDSNPIDKSAKQLKARKEEKRRKNIYISKRIGIKKRKDKITAFPYGLVMNTEIYHKNKDSHRYWFENNEGTDTHMPWPTHKHFRSVGALPLSATQRLPQLITYYE